MSVKLGQVAKPMILSSTSDSPVSVSTTSSSPSFCSQASRMQPFSLLPQPTYSPPHHNLDATTSPLKLPSPRSQTLSLLLNTGFLLVLLVLGVSTASAPETCSLPTARFLLFSLRCYWLLFLRPLGVFLFLRQSCN